MTDSIPIIDNYNLNIEGIIGKIDFATEESPRAKLMHNLFLENPRGVFARNIDWQ